MELNDRERALVLAGLFELRITHLEDTARCEAIDALVEKLGGDRSAMCSSEPTLTSPSKGRVRAPGRSGRRCSGVSGDVVIGNRARGAISVMQTCPYECRRRSFGIG